MPTKRKSTSEEDPKHAKIWCECQECKESDKVNNAGIEWSHATYYRHRCRQRQQQPKPDPPTSDHPFDLGLSESRRDGSGSPRSDHRQNLDTNALKIASSDDSRSQSLGDGHDDRTSFDSGARQSSGEKMAHQLLISCVCYVCICICCVVDIRSFAVREWLFQTIATRNGHKEYHIDAFWPLRRPQSCTRCMYAVSDAAPYGYRTSIYTRLAAAVCVCIVPAGSRALQLQF